MAHKQAMKAKRTGAEILLQKYGTGAGMPVIYGTRRVAGTVVYMNTTNNKELFVVYAIAGHEIDSFDLESLQIDGRTIKDLNIYRQGYDISDGTTRINYRPSGETRTSGTFWGNTSAERANITGGAGTGDNARMTFNCHKGTTAQTADPMLEGIISEWTSNHKLSGIAYIACNYEYDIQGMFTGIPNLTVVVNGKKVYDPRTATTGFSSNPALCLLDYLTDDEYGKGLDINNDIDTASFSTSANDCDVSADTITHSSVVVENANTNTDILRIANANEDDFNNFKIGNTYTVTDGVTTYVSAKKLIDKDVTEIDIDGTNAKALLKLRFEDGAVGTAISSNTTCTFTETQIRFDCNGVLDTDETVLENTKLLVANMRGIFTYTNGKYSIKVEGTESSVVSLDEDDILESGITLSLENKEAKYNRVEAEFYNAQKKYETDTTYYTGESGDDFLGDDGDELLETRIQLPFCTNQRIAYNHAKAMLKRSRSQKTISFVATPKILQAKVGEVISITNSNLNLSSEQYRITNMVINPDLNISVNAIEYQSAVYGYVTPDNEVIGIGQDPVIGNRVEAPTNLSFTNKQTDGEPAKLTWTDSTKYPSYEFRVQILDGTKVRYDRRVKDTYFYLDGITLKSGYVAKVSAINALGVESDTTDYNFNVTTAPITTVDIGQGSIGGFNFNATKMYYGAGNFDNTDTSVYFDSAGQFSLKDKLSWNGTTLDISGNLTVENTITADKITLGGTALDDIFSYNGVTTNLSLGGSLTVSGDISNFNATAEFGTVTVGDVIQISSDLSPSTTTNALYNQSGTLYWNGNGFIDSSGNGTFNNLTVNGTTTTLNTATLDVEDKNITLNYGAGDTSASANGAGITIQDAVNSTTDATILWDTTNDEFDFSHGINVSGVITASTNSNTDVALSIGSSSSTNYTLQRWITSAHSGNTAYMIAYGASHSTQAGNFAMKNIKSGGEIFFELFGVEPLRLTSTGATFAGTIDSGAITSSSTVDATGYQINGTNFADESTNGAYHVLRDPTGKVAIFLGGSDEGNYYDNNNHYIRNRSSSNLVQINSNGINLHTGTYRVGTTTVIDTNRSLQNINGVYAGFYSVRDTRNASTSTDEGEKQVRFDFKANNNGDSLSDGGSYHGQLLFQQWNDSSGGDTHALGFTDNGNIWHRRADIGGTWDTWYKIVETGRSMNVSFGTISSGAITSSSTIATGSFTLPNSSGTAGQVLRYPSSGSTLVWEDDDSGLISAITNFSNNRVLTASGSDSINGESQLTFDGTTLAIRDAVYITNYTSADTDITGLVAGSTFGGLIQGDGSGHLVIGLQDNGGSDSFAIVSGGGNFTTDTTYDTLAFQVDALGNTKVGNQLTTGDKIYLTSVASSGADGILAFDSTNTASGSRVFSFTRAGSNELRYHSYGFHKWWSGGASGTADSTARMTLDGSGNLDLITGGLEINGTEVIDTSRNIKAVDVNLSGSIQNTVVPAEASVKINENGYADGTTYFRDLDIYDGKGNQFVKFDGSTQRVGVGTTSPASSLHVHSTNYTAATFERNIALSNYGVSIDLKNSEDNIFNLACEGTEDFSIGYTPSGGSKTNLFTLNSSGNVGINNTSPSARLQIEEYGIDTTETSTSATTQVAVDTFASATFRSARYTVQVTNSTDSTYHMTEILLIHDGTTPSITEYGTIFTGASAEATFDADISTGNVRLLATPASTDSMEFKVVRHCITT